MSRSNAFVWTIKGIQRQSCCLERLLESGIRRLVRALSFRAGKDQTMPIKTKAIDKLEQLPEAARDRIAQLRLLFVDRSKGHLAEILQALEERKTADEPRASDADLIKLAHSLVGASGIFGHQALGNAAFEVESTLRLAEYSDAEFDRVIAGLIGQLQTLA